VRARPPVRPSTLAAASACGLALAGVAGCGAGGDPAAVVHQPTETATTWSDPSAPAGEPDPRALEGFACGSAGGVWSATGTLTHRGREPADYVVTVLVSGAEAVTAGARRLRVRGLDPGESVPLRLPRLPAPAASRGLTCQVQVLRR